MSSTVTGTAGAQGTPSHPDGYAGGTAQTLFGLGGTSYGVLVGGAGGGSRYNFGQGGNGGTGLSMGLELTLQNSGTISGGAGGSALYPGGVGGVGGIGVYFYAGDDTLTNAATISGGAGGTGGGVGGVGGIGVDVAKGGDTLINAGTISGGVGGYGGTAGDAVYFSGGSVASRLIVDPGAVFNGQVVAKGTDDTLELAAGGSHATLTGFGIQFTGFDQILVDSGATWDLAGTPTVGSGSTLTNDGTISEGSSDQLSVLGVLVNNGDIGTANTHGSGVAVAGGGTLTNAGTISGGNEAVYLGGSGGSRLIVDPGAVFVGHVVAKGSGNTLELAAGGSQGNLSGFGSQFTGFDQIQVDRGATWDLAGATPIMSSQSVTDDGTISEVMGDQLINAGTLDVAAGALLSNAGIIETTSGIGIDVAAGGTVSNAGRIESSSGNGIDVAAGGTVSNAGTIAGSSGSDAVYFGGSGGSRLIVDPRSVFNGQVVAEGTDNTLELAAGGSHGTLSGFGIQFTGFDKILVDSGATWDLAGTPTVGSGTTLTNDGTISEGPNDQLSVVGVLVNDGDIGTTNTKGSGVAVAGGGTLTNAGTIAGSSEAVYFGGSGGSRLIDKSSGVFNGQVVAKSSNDTLELAAGGSHGTLSGFGTQFIGFDQILVDSGATWDVAGTTTIASSQSVTDDGTISEAVGDQLINGGSLDVAAGALLSNAGTIQSTNGSGMNIAAGGTLSNAGLIEITSGNGIDVAAGGTVSNTGTIESATGNGIEVAAGALLSNTGTIQTASGDGIDVGGGGTLSNAGSIGGSSGSDAVYFGGSGGSRLIDDSGGVFNGQVVAEGSDNTFELGSGITISGLGTEFTGFDNVQVDAGASWDSPLGLTLTGGSTATNAGTITGGGGEAVYFGGGGGSRVVVDPGAVFNGQVVAEGTDNTLELAGGKSNGTLSGLQTQFSGFDQIQVDSYAIWDLAGTTTIASNMSVTGDGHGSLRETAGDYLINDGTISAYVRCSGGYSGGTALNATITNDGTIGDGIEFINGGTLTNAGTIGNFGRYDSVQFGGRGNSRLIVDPGAVFNGGVEGNGGRTTLELAAGASVGTINGYANSYGFEKVQVDSGAAWDFVGSLFSNGTVNVAGSGILTNNGTLFEGFLIDAGTFTNIGTISSGGRSVSVSSGGTLTNDGVMIGSNVSVSSGGSLINDGTMSGYYLNSYGGFGGSVYVGLGGDLTNAGTISGRVGGSGQAGISGVVFTGGGSLSNGYLIQGGSSRGFSAGASGTGGTGGDGVRFDGVGTLANTGTIDAGAGGGAGSGYRGGTFAYGGAGGDGVHFGGNGDLTNSGIISGGSDGYGYGRVAAVASGDGAFFGGGGTLTNAGTGTISGGNGVYSNFFGGIGGVGVDVTGGGGTVTNAGGIVGGAGGGGSDGSSGSGGDGVDLVSGGTLTNAATGTISGGAGGGGYFTTGGAGGIGVQLASGGTFSNAGTVSGGSGGYADGYGFGSAGDAVYFGGSGGSRLVVDPGAVFNGQVMAKGSGNTLELAAGTGPGTLGGIGTQFSGFSQLSVDLGAVWDLSGSATLASTVTVVNAGTISETGSDGLTINGELTGTGVIRLDPTTVTLNGAVEGRQTIEFAGAGDVLALAMPNHFQGTIDGFGVGETIDLTGVPLGSISQESFANGHLTIDTSVVGDFILDFSNPSSFAGLSFHLTADGSGTAITVACYCPGTLILTPAGEVAVEDLAIGDWVITHSGEAEPVRWIGRRRYAGRFIQGEPHILPIRIQSNALSDGIPRRDLWVSPQHALYLDGYLVPAIELVNGISITQEPVQQLEYIHIELASHSLIWAEGAAAETFVDDNSRLLFENAHEYAQLYPDEEPSPAQFCAERLSGCYEAEMIRWRLADRAEALWLDSNAKAA